MKQSTEISQANRAAQICVENCQKTKNKALQNIKEAAEQIANLDLDLNDESVWDVLRALRCDLEKMKTKTQVRLNKITEK